MITKEQTEEISALYSKAILENDDEAKLLFQERMLSHFMDYEKAMKREQERAEDYLEEPDEIQICANCGNPLIWTFAFPYKERYCLHCGVATPMFDGSKSIPGFRDALKTASPMS